MVSRNDIVKYLVDEFYSGDAGTAAKATGHSQIDSAPKWEMANWKFVKMPVVSEMTEKEMANIENILSER